MKKLFVLSFVFLSFLGYSQKQVFESPELASLIKEHKTVAILPFTVKITYKKQPKNFSVEGNRDQELKMSKSIQSSMYTFLLRKADSYAVNFQDVEKTNILLKKSGIADKLDEMTKDEVAKALGVDAVISGTFESEQSKSEGAAIATAVLLGGFGGKTGSGSLTMTINNGKDGEMLWRFFKTMNDNISISTDDIVESMMRKVSRNFPYLK
ncbi:hypothetical protein IWX83_002222 [Flavobacterium sp. CG_9.1]|uniref:DUF4410 domain-containing protein n=1 Tax=Flavobacterium xanthum TaxID=69322 RepID=A0A1M7H4E4_9FLAO|nr:MULTISPECIES: hypothetical protein [Flavobacterium]MBG6062422.1 hypothetical protein [Flavobacterium sp. CG_9.1]SHM23514.1 hypothetical protein SAMN05443669_102633 [Flavobacterium xanthum]